jgi:N utilization substance protein A
VQAVVDELFGEKIDIIPWGEELEQNVSNSLSPAKVEKVVYDEDENMATVVVPDYQLSLAIGKEGQNVRLAAKLAGMKIDIKSHTQYFGGASEELAGMLDDEGYLNPDDFVTDKDAEAPEESEADLTQEAPAEEPAESEASAEAEIEDKEQD